MPRFDGTGPQGQGPMTGRGQGYCILPYEKVPRTPPPSQGYGRGYGQGYGQGYGPGYGPGYGLGYGFGRGPGRGLGRGRGYGFYR